jgi:16S rRNA (cytidine1402-2'-O)-methyltransferase
VNDGGRLVLVATPIGNLADLSPRAVGALRDAELICCEDTRRTGRLLQHAGVVAKRLAVANEHTERARVGDVLDVLGAGGDVALVTDAGTPGISDPGERLVRAVLDAGFDVAAVPGPAAFVTALVASGLPTGRFAFEGFLPRSGAARRERLAAVAREERTVVLYEAPHRLDRTLGDLAEACGESRPVVLARELTKRFEEYTRGTLGTIDAGTPRGEYVLVVGPAPEDRAPVDAPALNAAIDGTLDRGLPTRDATAEVAAAFGLGRREVYELVVARRAARREDPRVR